MEKDLNSRMVSRGFGDTLAKMTKATGIDKAVKVATKAVGIEDCGCDNRQESLNNPNLLVNKLLYKK